MLRKITRDARVGIDIGRVIIGAADHSGQADTVFLTGGEEQALRTAATEGAFDTIREVVARTDGRVWLVSKCGPRIQARTRRWLRANAFAEKTGFRPDQIRFCRKRHEKRDHASALELTHFIDDRPDVLRHLIGLVPTLILFGHQSRPVEMESVTAAVDWSRVRALLL